MRISKLPFHTGTLPEEKSTMPKDLPLTLHFDSKTNIIRQKISPKLKDSLKTYYLLGGYASEPLGEGTYGTRRAQIVMRFIKKSLLEMGKDFKNSTFLEIGSAYGYLLYLIKKEGAKEVLGLEPGNEGAAASKKYKIKTVKDFFPSPKIKKKFDCILSHCVLEHLENPQQILFEMQSALENSGFIFIAAPDCEDKMIVGDISIIAHQHINYFTKQSLGTLMRSCGYIEVKVVKTKEIAMLCAWGKKHTKKIAPVRIGPKKDNRQLLKIFQMAVKTNLASIQKLVREIESKNKTIGLYGYSPNLRGLVNFKREPRIFDGDSAKFGKKLIGTNTYFESPKDLIEKPVDVLFVTPIDYDKEIRRNLKKSGLDVKMTSVISLKDIYEKNSKFKYSRNSGTS